MSCVDACFLLSAVDLSVFHSFSRFRSYVSLFHRIIISCIFMNVTFVPILFNGIRMEERGTEER